ncbi:antibiotic biosynthesis monooxygenase family protein [Teredinibacter franksiae]|jgi:Antibiotic biosynthesis monooxygenase.|uniref:antibiotic biosynthesis monooxygenase family protein n=1 Tax=Teredinibacter franksiae TaxID=2761453 RepID=UPI001628B480|nr:antibiotic biosynthesis monooxygenase [Teredinibacter franksiae]
MVHVLIERSLHEGQLSTYLEQAKIALQKTYVVPGFISGEAFANIQDENHRFLLCKWKSLEDWQRWSTGTERKEVLSAVHAILRQPEKICVLEN